MNTNDKNYVDRLHNQQVNELNEIKNRLLILEGKTTTTTDGNIRVEIDTDKIYEMFLKACHEWRATAAGTPSGRRPPSGKTTPTGMRS